MFPGRTWLLVGLFSSVGCASIQISPERFAKTSASIRGAEEVGAPNVPKARLHLQFAKDQAELAKTLADRGDGRAEDVLIMAEADADLALELAREETLKTEGQRVNDELKALQERTGQSLPVQQPPSPQPSQHP